VSTALKRLTEAFSFKTRSGYAFPQHATVYETPSVPLADVMALYERDPTCKASVDLLAASAVGAGFYTTVDANYEKAAEAKRAVDAFGEAVNLDALLCDMARVLIACGNDFWLKLTPENLADVRRLPVDSVERIVQSSIGEKQSVLRIPYKVESYKLRQTYGGESLAPEAVVHWRINCLGISGYGTGVLQVLLHSLVLQSDKRPAFAWMKAKIERIMPRIFEKYAGPDVLALLERADEATIRSFEKAIKNRGEEGAWLFYNGKGEIQPVTLDPRARFEYYVEHLINQFYLGCETPLPRLFSTPGFTEASAKAALELQNMLINPVQRYIKRQVERELFSVVLAQAGFDPLRAQARLHWGTPQAREMNAADLLRAAELGLIEKDEFRKNSLKFGWELWQQPQSEVSVKGAKEKVLR
jgi:class 3 adenylate cyclase